MALCHAPLRPMRAASSENPRARRFGVGLAFWHDVCPKGNQRVRTHESYYANTPQWLSTEHRTMKNSNLIYLLNQQLNREISALLRYMIEAAAIKGAEQEIVRTTYLKGVSEKIEHAQSLADQIVTLGGTPNLHPVHACPPASVREMLRHDADEEKRMSRVTSSSPLRPRKKSWWS